MTEQNSTDSLFETGEIIGDSLFSTGEFGKQ